MRHSVLIALCTIVLFWPVAVLGQYVPQACHDGQRYFENKQYDQSIDAYNDCIASGAMSNDIKATAYHNRAAARYGKFSESANLSDAAETDLLEKGYKDADNAISLKPNDEKAYCLRGWFALELSWGFDESGYDDIEKGIANGADKDLCWADYNF